jgi:predicted nucleic acid-binding protein
MNNYPLILIDTGILVAFYDRKDKYHQQVVSFFSTCTSQLITTIACITEVMWLLAPHFLIFDNGVRHLQFFYLYYTEILSTRTPI